MFRVNRKHRLIAKFSGLGHRGDVSNEIAAAKENAVGRPAAVLSDLIENWRDVMHAIYGDGGFGAEVKVALAIPPLAP